jgi:hypothetical protein
MQEILVDGRQLVGKLNIEVFDCLWITEHGVLYLARGNLPAGGRPLANEAAISPRPVGLASRDLCCAGGPTAPYITREKDVPACHSER